jgi:hypothetical protein
LWLGALLAAALIYNSPPQWPGLPEWAWWPTAVGLCAAAGLVSQLLMIGAQGAFAQVLPGPGGRSIRGHGAVATGWLILAGVVLLLLSLTVRSDELPQIVYMVAGAGSVSLVAGLVTDAWCWPAMVKDFDARGE